MTLCHTLSDDYIVVFSSPTYMSLCGVASNKKKETLTVCSVEAEDHEVSHCSALDQTRALKTYFPMFKGRKGD